MTEEYAGKLWWQCVVCHKVTTGRIPRCGDGSLVYPRRHKNGSGAVCEGIFMEARPVVKDGSGNVKRLSHTEE